MSLIQRFLSSRNAVRRGRRESERRRRRLFLQPIESLEPRLVLAGISLSGGDVAITGGLTNDQLTISSDGTHLVLESPDGVTPGSGATQLMGDPNKAGVPLAQVTGTVTVSAGDGIDSVSFQSTDIGGASLVVLSEAETVDVAASASVVADGGIALNADHTITVNSGASLLADAGPSDITLNISKIDYLSDSPLGVSVGTVSINVDSSAAIRGDNIAITATRKSDISSPLRPFGGSNLKAEVVVDGASIEGSTIAIRADAADQNSLDQLLTDVLPTSLQWLPNFTLKPFEEFFFDGLLPGIPLGAMIRGSDASVSVHNSQLVSTGNVDIESTTVVDATVTAADVAGETLTKTAVESFLSHFSATLSHASGTADTELTGTTSVQAGGHVLVKSDATTTASASSRTTANIDAAAAADPKSLVASFALSMTETHATTHVESGVSIDSSGNVNVSALGTVTNSASSNATAYVDGFGGLSISLGFDDSDATATVDGTINADGATVVRDVDLTNVNGTNNTITIPNHEFTDGQLVEYFARNPADPGIKLDPIGGLLSGEFLRVIVIDANTIQLARTEELDLAHGGSTPASTQTLTLRDTTVFDPQTAVDTANNWFTIADHGFVTGQAIGYSVGSADDQPIGSTAASPEYQPATQLTDQGTYYAIRLDDDRFQFALTAADAAGGIAVPLTTAGVGNAHILSFETDARSFMPATGLNAAQNTISISTNGISTGDPLVYRTDPNQQRERTISRSATFDPSARVNTFDPTGTVDFGESVVNLATSTISLLDHGLSTADEVTYETNGGTPIGTDPPGLLVDGQSYFVIKVDDDTIQLAESAADANSATAIALAAGASDGPQQLVTASGTPRTLTFDPLGTVREPVVDLVSNTILVTPLHNLVTGQRVTYSADSGTPVGGLTDNTDYFAIAVTENEVRLAASRADALAGNAIVLSSGASGMSHTLSSTQVDADNDLIISPAHGLETGQTVTYNQGDGTPIGGLNNAATYFAIRLDENTVQLAATVADAAAGTAIGLTSGGTGQQQSLDSRVFVSTIAAGLTAPVVDTTANTIQLPDHGLATGQEINYQTSAGQAIGGLANNTNYFIIRVDDNTVQLAASAPDALSGTAINLTSAGTIGTGLHVFRIIPTVDIFDRPDELIAFDPTVVPPVDTAANTILLRNHGFTTADSITYLTGGGNPIGGLSNGVEYFVIVVDDHTLRLADSAANAGAGIALPLGTGATGDRHGLERASVATENDRPISGLQDGAVYYAIVDNANTLRLSDSQQDALAAKPIDLDPSVATGTVHSLVPYGEGQGIKVFADLTAKNSVNAGASLGSQPTISNLLTKGELQTSITGIKSILNFSAAKQFASANGMFPGNKPNSAVSAAGGLAWNSFNHDVLAKVGGTAQLSSDLDIEVDANLSQKAQIVVQGNSSPGSAKKFALGAAGGLGFYDNTVRALVDDGATLDAAANVTVDSNLTYPLYVTPLTLAPFSSFFTDASGMFGFDPSKPDLINDLATTLDGKLGLSRIFNVWATSQVFTTKADNLPEFSVTASVGAVDYTNVSEAIIGDGARINQNTQNDDQVVTVEASTVMQLVNLAGILHLRLNLDGIVNAVRQGAPGNPFSFFGNKSATFGAGGSLMLQFFDNQTNAIIKDNAEVHSGDDGGLNVTANEDLSAFEFAQSGGDSGNIGISGSLSLVDQTSSTVAQLQSGAMAVGGPLTVKADNQANHVNLVGSVQLAKRLGVGVAAAVSLVDRDTLAIIGNRRTASDMSVGSAGTDIRAESITTTATNGGYVWTFGLVGALASNIPTGGGSSKQAEAGEVKATSGVGIAGDASVNVMTDNTQAYINDSGTIQTTGNVDMSADNGTLIVTAAGAGAIAIKPDGSVGGALAGSFAYNDLALTTEAFIIGANMSQAADVTLNASTDGQILAISGGLAGALAKTAVTVAGSLSWNDITNTVQTYFDGVQLDPSGAIRMTATDSRNIQADGGAAAIAASRATMGLGGAIAFGVSAGINNVVEVVKSFINNSVVAGPSSVDLQADAEPTVDAITWAGSFGGGFGASGSSGLEVSGAGAGSGNTIDNTTEALIQGGSSLSMVGAGGVALAASDTSKILANAGGVALELSLGGGSNVAVTLGAALSINEIGNNGGSVKASIDDSSVTSAGDVVLTAESTPQIEAVSVAVSLGATMGGTSAGVSIDGAGAGSGNSIRVDTGATITNNSQVTTTGTGAVSLTASDDSTISAVSPAVSLDLTATQGTSGTLTVGVAVSANEIGNSLSSNIDDSTVMSALNLELTADSTTKISSESVAVSSSLDFSSASAIALSGVGASTTNTVTNSVDASITNGSIAHAGGTADNLAVALSATDDSEISTTVVTATLGVAVGANPTGSIDIAASLATNTIGTDGNRNSVTSRIDNSIVTAAGPISVTAKSLTHIGGTTVGVSADISGTEGAALAVSGFGANTKNTVRNEVDAAITGGSRVSTTNGGTITVMAEEHDATISASATGGSGSIGVGTSGLSGTVTVGAVLTTNDVQNHVVAQVDDATVESSSDLSVQAASNLDLESLTVYVSISVSYGSTGGLAADGDGSNSTNRIQNSVAAAITGSPGAMADPGISTTGSGNILVTATDRSTITASAGGGNLAVGAGGAFGGSIAVAVVLAENDINNTLQSYVENSFLVSANDVSVSTTSTPKISATTVAVSVSGAGAPEGGAGTATAAASQASNTVRSTASAFLDQATVTAGGAVSVMTDAAQPDSDPNIQAVAPAVSVGVALTDPLDGIAFALTGAGGEADNTSTRTVNASIQNQSTVSAAGTVTVNATDTTVTEATIVDVTVGVSEFSGTVAVSLGTSSIADTVQAHVSQSNVTSLNGDLIATADASPSASTTAIPIAVAAGISVSGAGSHATSEINGSVAAFVDGQSGLTAPNGTVRVESTSSADSSANSTGVSVGIGIAVAALLTDATIGQATEAFITGGSTVDAGNLTVRADSAKAHATATTTAAAVGLISGAGGNATASVSGPVTAYVGTRAGTAPPTTPTMVTLGSGAATVEATAQETKAHADASGGAGSTSIAVSVLTPTATVEGSTTAYVGEGATVSAASLGVHAMATNLAKTESTVVGISEFSGAGVSASATDRSATTAYVGTADGETPSGQTTTVTLTTGDAVVESNLTSKATVDVNVAAAGIVASGAGTTANATMQPSVQAYLGDNTRVMTGGDVTVSSIGATQAEITSFGLSVAGGAGGAGTGATADLSPTLDVFTGSGVEIHATNVTLQVRNNAASDGTPQADPQVKIDATAGSGALIATGEGVNLQGSVSPMIENRLGAGTTVNASGAVSLMTQSNQNVDGSANSDGAAGGVAVGVTLATLVAQGSTQTHVDGTIASSGSVAITSGVTADVDAYGQANGGSLLGNGVGTNAQGTIGDDAGAPMVETYVGTTGVINSSGAVDIATTFGQTVTINAAAQGGSGAINVGTTLATGRADGFAQTYVDGTVASSASVLVATGVTASVDSTGEANGGALGGSGEGTNVQSIVGSGDDDRPMAETFVGSMGTVNSTGDIGVTSLVTSDAAATSSAINIAAVITVSSIPATATLQPVVKTHVVGGGSVSSTGGDVHFLSGNNYNPAGAGMFLADKKADVTTTNTSGSLGVDVQTTSITANAEAHVATMISSGATVSAAAGDVTVGARSSNLADASLSNGGGALIRYSGGTPTANVAGITSAEVNGDILDAVNVTVTAQASDVSNADLSQNGGGGISVTTSHANASSSPSVTATLAGHVTASGAVTFQSDSFTDADATIRNSSGGAIDIDTYSATVNVNGHAATNIMPAASIDAGTVVMLSSEHGEPVTDLSDGTFNAATQVNPAADTITFSEDHGLQTGNSVTYDDRMQTPIGGLTSGRLYDVITVDATTLELGSTFFAQVPAAGSPAGVDVDDDTITFAGPHDLEGNGQLGSDQVTYRVPTGSVPVGGLINGQTYLVNVVDSTTVRLVSTADVPDPPTNFAGTQISMNTTFNLPGHGFVLGEPVSYVAPAPAAFNSTLVDIVVSGDPPMPVSTPSADNIYLGEDLILAEDFQNGDLVIYTSDGAPITNLTSGSRYAVIYDPAKPDQIQLADPATPTVPIGLDPSGVAASVTHTLLDVEDQPIQGLTSQRTYYAANVMPNSFQLAPTLADALAGTNIVPMNPTDPGMPMNVLTGTRNTIGSRGVDLTSVGSGQQQLVLDLTSVGSGMQQLVGVGGPQGLAGAPSGDGIATASVSGSGGGVVQVSNADTTATSTPSASTTIGSNATLRGNRLELSSDSAGNVSGSSANSGGGFVSIGAANSEVSVYNTGTTMVDDGATLTAGDEIQITSKTSELASDITSTGNSGFAGVPTADANATIDYSSQVVIHDADLTATNQVTLNAMSDFSGSVTAYADGSGVGSGSFANDDDNKGLFIGNSQALTTTQLNSGATITANAVSLAANVTGMNGTVEATAKGAGLGGNSNAEANLTVNDTTNVILNSGAMIDGDQVTIESNHSGMNLSTHSDSGCDCLGGADNSNATTTYDSNSQVTGHQGAIITTEDLSVASNQNPDSIRAKESHESNGIVFGSHNETTHFNAYRNISWDATVILTGTADPQLIVDANGTVVAADDVTLNGGVFGVGDTIPVGTTIIVDDIINDMDGEATFAANIPAKQDDETPPAGVISGSQGSFEFHRTFGSVQISNASPRDLEVNEVDVYFVPDPSDAEITINVQTDNDFEFDILNDLGPTVVTIENTHPTAAPLLTLNGLIDNPIGATTITNASGDIIGTATGTVRTNILTIAAPQGNIGKTGGMIGTNRVVVQLVQSPGRLTQLNAQAPAAAPNGTTALSVQGLLRDPAITTFLPNIDLVKAGDLVDLILAEGLQQTNVSLSSVGINVFETAQVTSYPLIGSPSNAPPRTTAVEDHWPPSGGMPANPDPGLFGSGNTVIETTYTFTGQFNGGTETRRLQSGGDIRVQGCAPGGCTPANGMVNVLGNTVLTSLSSGVVNVATNGSIDLTEVVAETTNRAMRVGVIRSGTRSVRLAVPDTAASGEDLLMFDDSQVGPNGSRVDAATSVTLEVGDNVLMAGNIDSLATSSQINAGTTVVIDGDFANADPGVGTVIDLSGQITGNTSNTTMDADDLKRVVLVRGQADADIVSLTNVTAGSGTTVQTQGQDDLIQVGSRAQVDVGVNPPVGTNTGGVLHHIQALLTIDAGDGIADVLTADDSGDMQPDVGVLTFDTITCFHMMDGIKYLNVEELTITMGQANDRLDVDSTNAETESQVFGNGGDDAINVGKLAGIPLAGNSCPQVADTVDCIQGVLRVAGGPDYDTLTVNNTGQTAPRSGTLTGTTVTGLNMGPEGIEYSELEAVDVQLGQAADQFQVASTAAPQGNGNTTISAVRGGGGADMLTVSGGGGPDSPLVVYGDFTGTGTPANDTIDASAATAGIMVDGNQGDDQITGSQGGDNLAGSAGADTINGQDGTDNVLGDSGFVVDLRSRVTAIITTHEPGNDILNGQQGPDRLLGDHGILIPSAGHLLVTTAADLARIETANESVGGDDRISGGPDDDIALGGQANDTLFGNEGDDHVLGDNGRFDFGSSGLQFTPRPDDGGNDNIFGDSGNNDDPPGNDLLYDGPADDELDGGPGDDTFRLLPGNEQFADGSRDYLSDIRGSDTVDFSLAMTRSDCLAPASATDECGIMIDMDLLGFTDDAFSQLGPADRTPITQDAPQQVPQDMTIDDRVSLLRIGAFGQTDITPSPFENVIGSQFNDTFWIEALTVGGDIPQNGPPVARNVNGNPPVVGDPAVPPGDKLWFDAEGRPVLDTGLSLTAVGIGTVTYQSIETLCVFDQAPRIIDDGDDAYTQHPITAVNNISPISNWNPIYGIGYGGDYRYHLPNVPNGPYTATWTFNGLVPGKYRVSVTYPADPSHPEDGSLGTNAPFSVFDDGRLLATRAIDERLAADSFLDAGVFWQDLGIFAATSHTLTVQLSDQSNGQVMADAIRIEPVADGPSVRVLELDSQQSIQDAVSIVSMSTTIETPVTETFLIQNQGDEPLEIDAIEVAGPGAANYTVTPAITPLPTTVLPGESISFNVRLNAATANGFGPFPAEIQIFSNDMSTSVPRKPGAGVPTTDPGMDVEPFHFAIDGLVSDRLIVDDGDPDFSLVGVWQSPSTAGFQGDGLFTSANNAGNRAIWSFSGLPDGLYRVSTSYFAENGASTRSPFTVSDANGLLGSVSIDQTQTPEQLGGFPDAETFWVDLGGPYQLVGGELIVNLLDTANQPDRIVLADAVRVERVLTSVPDIRVEVDGQEVPLGGVVDFGTWFPYREVTKTFDVTNVGAGSLTISEPIDVPPGFTLVEFDGQTPTGSLTATAPTSFVLRYDNGGVGTIREPVSFADDDPNENPFQFFVTADTLQSQIVDDQDADGFVASSGFVSTGTGLSNDQGFHGEVHFANGSPGAAGESATWTFTGLTAGQEYIVSATWSPAANRATDAPFTVAGVDDAGVDDAGIDPPVDNDGQVTVAVNQQVTPDDRAVNGTQFEDLGFFTVTGTTLTVTLSNDANGQVIADAIRIEAVVSPQIVVEQNGVRLHDQQDTIEFGSASVAAGGATINRTFTIRNEGNRAMALGTPVLPVGFQIVGNYPSQIAAGGAANVVIGLSRAAAGAYAGTLQIVADEFDENPFEIELVGSILGSGTIIDNSDGLPGYTSTGFISYSGQGRDGNVQASGPGTGNSTATFTFNVTPGLYRVSATWSEYFNRATDAPYDIYDGVVSGSPQVTTTLNQQRVPDDFVDDGSNWEDVGMVRVTGSTLTVQLNNGANGDVVADAIRIEPLPMQPELAVYDSSGGKIAAGDQIDFGTLAPGASQSETFTVRNLGSSPLDLGMLQMPADFVLATPPGATTLAPYDPAGTSDETTFTVLFDPPAVGNYIGEARLPNTDSNQNPFAFYLTGAVQPAVLIVDDSDAPGLPGYVDTGFTTFTGQGYLSTVSQSLAGAGDTATWSFVVDANKSYRVSATWTPFSNRATNAPYTISGGAGGSDLTFLVNQQIAPNDRNDAGVNWEDLAVIRTVGTTLTVTLNDSANGNVIADAIRLEELPDAGPSILVSAGSASISNETGSVELASVLNDPVSQVINVVNMGTSTLTLNNGSLQSSLAGIPGLSLVGSGFGSASLGPGGATTFEIQLDAVSPGNVSGTVLFDNNDPQANPYEFSVVGTVSSPIAIIDNSDPVGPPGYEETGPWLHWSGQGVQGNVSEAVAGGAVETATWTFAVVAGGVYDVAATWTPFGNRATDAPYAIGGVTQPTTVSINQRIGPDSFQSSGTAWESLGTFTATGTNLTVTLSGSTTGNVIADAVRIEQLTDPEIRVTANGTEIVDGTGNFDFGSRFVGATGISQVFTVTNVGAAPLILQPVLVTGNFQLDTSTYPNFVVDQSLAVGASVQFEIMMETASPGSRTGTVAFGNNDADEGPFEFNLTGNVTDTMILDDGDAGYTDTGNMQVWNQGYQNDVREAVAGGTPQGASYVFNDLPAGIYRISATWTPYSNRASNATYTLNAVAATPVNQKLAPSNVAATPQGTVVQDPGSGTYFADLDNAFSFVGGTLTVGVSDMNANGNVIIDAIRVERVGPLMAPSAWSPATSVRESLNASDVAPVLRAAIDHWAEDDPRAAAKLSHVDVIIRDLPQRVLGLGSFSTPTIWLDDDAAGLGWNLRSNSDLISADFRQVDLLAVVTHELGHVLGHRDLDPNRHPHHIMAGTLHDGWSALNASHAPQPQKPSPFAGELGIVDRTAAHELFARLGQQDPAVTPLRNHRPRWEIIEADRVADEAAADTLDQFFADLDATETGVDPN